jgi:hypothetical protein
LVEEPTEEVPPPVGWVDFEHDIHVIKRTDGSLPGIASTQIVILDATLHLSCSKTVPEVSVTSGGRLSLPLCGGEI